MLGSWLLYAGGKDRKLAGLLEEPARESPAKGELLRERGRGKGANREKQL